MSLTHSMIPLGSCTMKLNSADVLSSLTNPSWGNIHPYLPKKYQHGYNELIGVMESNIKKSLALIVYHFNLILEQLVNIVHYVLLKNILKIMVTQEMFVLFPILHTELTLPVPNWLDIRLLKLNLTKMEVLIKYT